jgi:hypothetical protein
MKTHTIPKSSVVPTLPQRAWVYNDMKIPTREQSFTSLSNVRFLKKPSLHTRMIKGWEVIPPILPHKRVSDKKNIFNLTLPYFTPLNMDTHLWGKEKESSYNSGSLHLSPSDKNTNQTNSHPHMWVSVTKHPLCLTPFYSDAHLWGNCKYSKCCSPKSIIGGDALK